MGIIEKVTQDRITAMREKNAAVKSATQMLAARFKNEEIALKRPLEESEAATLVRKELKQVQDSLRDAQKAGRTTEEYEVQIAYIQGLLPAALTPKEIDTVIETAAAGLAALNKGSLMQAVMPLLKGRADGKDIAAAVDSYLKQNT